MGLKTITQVSKEYEISTRTLRYYEELGLIQSQKIPDYAYRMYDTENLIILQQILIFRKLRIPLKEIQIILESKNSEKIFSILEQAIVGIDSEMIALKTIRHALRIVVDELKKLSFEHTEINNFDDTQVINLIEEISTQTLKRKESLPLATIDEANKTIESIKDLRIIYVPPMTVAAFHLEGQNREEAVGLEIQKFITENQLKENKPDFRLFGFNNPAGDENISKGYEMWVSIPKEMAVNPPYVKKHFQGGLYGAKMIKFGDFHEWENLWQWVLTNGEYEFDYSSRVIPLSKEADPALEETLNAINHIESANKEHLQLDLLVPISLKKDTNQE
ncbi:effector binding domain-containing protein [Enterococcus sp. LJL120]